MRQTIRVNEYYDIYDYFVDTSTDDYFIQPTDLPKDIVDTEQTNSFRGFWNNKFYNYIGINNDAFNTPNHQLQYDSVLISGQIKSSQANGALRMDDNGDIWCYPPNVSVPYWSKIIFRNFDYKYIDSSRTHAELYEFTDRANIELETKRIVYPNDGNPIPEEIEVTYTAADELVNPQWVNGDTHTYQLWGVNTTTYATNNTYPVNFPKAYQDNFTLNKGLTTIDEIEGVFVSLANAPLFLRFDEYPSRSKVIFSGCDKTRNPDIVFNFAYKKGQIEPIKLNLSLTANIPVRDPTDLEQSYNQNLDKATIYKYINMCYWCIEWVYEPDEK